MSQASANWGAERENEDGYDSDVVIVGVKKAAAASRVVAVEDYDGDESMPQSDMAATQPYWSVGGGVDNDDGAGDTEPDEDDEEMPSTTSPNSAPAAVASALDGAAVSVRLVHQGLRLAGARGMPMSCLRDYFCNGDAESLREAIAWLEARDLLTIDLAPHLCGSPVRVWLSSCLV